MRRAAVLAGLVCLGVGPAGASAQELRLTPSAGAKFPERSYVLTLPAGIAPTSSDVRVTENGRSVDGLEVRSAAGQFAVVLAIDTSASMSGAALRGAIEAARAFAAQRPADQPLGIVLFSGTVRVLQRPTTDGAAIDRALADLPPLSPNTHIYDGTLTALELLGGYDAGAVVVLSDGQDYGSTASLDSVAQAAAQRNARIFSVGLRSSVFDPITLERLAETAQGEYLGAASTKGLTEVYERLGVELSSAYLLNWRSLRPAGSEVRVRVTLGDDESSAAYTAPKLDLPAAPAISSGRNITQTGAFAALMALVAAALCIGLTLAFLRRRDHHLAVRRRISGYGVNEVAVEAFTEDQPQKRRALGGARRARLEHALELGDISMSPVQFVAWVVVAALASALVFGAIAGGVVGFLAFCAAPLFARVYVRRQVAARRRKFADQLADAVQATASAMRTGHSLVGGLAQMVESAPEPMASELRRVVADERLGVPLEQAFLDVVERMDNRDLHQVALVSVLQREAGGNGAEALDRVVENLRARDDVRRLVDTLSSQGRLSGRVLLGLPIVSVALLSLINPDQMRPLYQSFAGHVALIVAAVMMLTASVWIRKIVDIRV